MDLIDRAEVLYKFAEILPEADSLEWYEQAKPDEVKELVDELCLIVLTVNQIDAQPVKHGRWSECYRDSRCISVICSVCKNPTVISHGCRDADEVTMDDVIERLPHCPKCCSDMGGDADEPH
jgi:hypothetical protein